VGDFVDGSRVSIGELLEHEQLRHADAELALHVSGGQP
jgi:hypothetical protein